MKNRHKYIFVVGGVMSGVGKGVSTSSIGAILQAQGFTRTTLRKEIEEAEKELIEKEKMWDIPAILRKKK
jgi:hypothetical protein